MPPATRSFISTMVICLLNVGAGVCIGTACLRPAPVQSTGVVVRTAGGRRIPETQVRPLRAAAAARHRQLGTAFMTHHLREPEFSRLASTHFDSLTPENEMKWENVEPRRGSYSFAAGDALVAFAAAHQMRVRGHTLVWHSQLPSWVKDLTADALRAALIVHVRALVSHWKGSIAQWDVVNEALADGDGGGLRADSRLAALGPDFIELAFRTAHDADPGALLFYNDYEIEAPGAPKTEAAHRLLKQLIDRGVPIHGIGLQMHVDPRRWPSPDDIRRNMARFASLGLLVEITEMDVPVGELPGTIDQKLERQRVLTHDIVAACLTVERCSGITFWGLTDKHSWLNSPRWGALRGRPPHYPLPFDADYRAKPMFEGIADALAGG